MREMTMTTHMKMLSSLALTTATLVTLSGDAHARLAVGGMRAFVRPIAVARTPMVVRRTYTAPTVRALNTVVRDTRRSAATVVRDHRTANVVVRDHRTANVVVRDH